MASEFEIPDVQLIDNSSQRLPLVLVLDGSGSMSGSPIAELNEGLKSLERELKADPVARLRVQLLVIRLGGHDEVEVVVDWTDAMNFEAPTIEANGNTPLGKAVRLALAKLDAQKRNYRAAAIPYNRPWLYILSDGQPNDAGWQSAAAECRAAIDEKKLVAVAIMTGGARAKALQEFTDTVLKLQGIKFRELFVWLSQSASVVSRASHGRNVQVPVPAHVLTIPS